MKKILKYIKIYFPIELTKKTPYGGWGVYDYKNGSSIISFLKTQKQMWYFRIWKGGNPWVITFGIGFFGFDIYLKIPRIKFKNIWKSIK